MSAQYATEVRDEQLEAARNFFGLAPIRTSLPVNLILDGSDSYQKYLSKPSPIPPVSYGHNVKPTGVVVRPPITDLTQLIKRAEPKEITPAPVFSPNEQVLRPTAEDVLSFGPSSPYKVVKFAVRKLDTDTRRDKIKQLYATMTPSQKHQYDVERQWVVKRAKAIEKERWDKAHLPTPPVSKPEPILTTKERILKFMGSYGGNGVSVELICKAIPEVANSGISARISELVKVGAIVTFPGKFRNSKGNLVTLYTLSIK